MRLIHTAIDAGITFLDNAWDYNDGLSEKRMGQAIADRRDRVFLMTKVCTQAATARSQCVSSKSRCAGCAPTTWISGRYMKSVFDDEPDRHFAEGGVVEALERARQQGKVRYLGFTGHKSPALHLSMLSRGFAWDACQLPLNCFDATFRSFEREVLPVLQAQGIAAIGMKSLGGDARQVSAGVVTAKAALAYAMSLPVATVVSGIDSPRVLAQNLSVARGFKPLTARACEMLRKRVASVAADGRFELYKTSAKFDGVEARRVHGLPPHDEMPM